MNYIGLRWRTVRHLTVRQVVYQLLKRLRGRPVLRLPKAVPKAHFLSVPNADKPVSWQNQTATFLNQSVLFSNWIDWNYSGNGKLWTYNLTYFDFLNQPGLASAEGLKLIHNFVALTHLLHDGLEPYPTSLRIMNWIQFLSRYQLRDDRINRHLLAQVMLLRRRLEYHLAGNHLLENGFALLMSALYFRHEGWFKVAQKIVHAELKIQVLADGSHDERSPMYHQLLLDRLLDVLLTLQHDTWQNNPTFVDFLTEKATQMRGWLSAITFSNGEVPMVNDAAFGIAPTTAQCLVKARKVLVKEHFSPTETHMNHLSDSGYRMFRQEWYELFVDIGPVGPNHQPGHAHADTFSFVLYVDNQPVIVDNGTSTYQIGKRRAWERSTAAHNTVEVKSMNSSEVWAGFRVGRRARVRVLTDTETALIAQHSGYGPLGIYHERTWVADPDRIRIVDRLLPKNSTVKTNESGVSRFYFHPAIPIRIIADAVVAGPIQLSFSNGSNQRVTVKNYELANGFNQLRPAQCLEIEFINRLETTLTLRHETALPDILFRA